MELCDIIVSNETKEENYMFNEYEHKIFDGVNVDILNAFLNDSRIERRSLKKGEVIFAPTSFSHSIGIITKGNAVIRRTHNVGDSVILRRIGEGEIFGVSALFSEKTKFVSEIVADNDCSAIFFSEDMIRELISKDSDFAINYITMLSNKIDYLNKLISGYSAQTANAKLAHFLLQNAEKYTVCIEYSMTLLSERIGIGRASLYRAIEELEEANIITRKGKCICISDIEKLKMYI